MSLAVLVDEQYLHHAFPVGVRPPFRVVRTRADTFHTDVVRLVRRSLSDGNTRTMLLRLLEPGDVGCLQPSFKIAPVEDSVALKIRHQLSSVSGSGQESIS